MVLLPLALTCALACPPQRSNVVPATFIEQLHRSVGMPFGTHGGILVLTPSEAERLEFQIAGTTPVAAPEYVDAFGRVVDDLGEPVADAELRSVDDLPIDSTSCFGRSNLDVTDADGCFRFRAVRNRRFVVSKPGHLPTPPQSVAPGSDSLAICLQRRATLRIACVPAQNLAPERFVVRWSSGTSSGAELLHAWTQEFDDAPGGLATVQIAFDDDPALVLFERAVELAPAETRVLDADLSACGMVFLTVRASDGAITLDAEVAADDSNRGAKPNALGVARIPTTSRAAPLTIRAPGFETVRATFGHGAHEVKLRPLH